MRRPKRHLRRFVPLAPTFRFHASSAHRVFTPHDACVARTIPPGPRINLSVGRPRWMRTRRQGGTSMGFSKRTRRGTALAAVAALTAVGLVGTAVAALQGNENAKKPKVLIGADNDDTSNTTIQPPGVTANQSLRKSDQIFGGKASDTIIG